MMPSLIILASLFVVGTVLWVHHRLTEKNAAEKQATDDAPVTDEAKGDKEVAAGDDECCGLHTVCEKLNHAALSDDLYYDDDELDAYAGRAETDYTAAETEQFRDIMLTLAPGEAAGWSIALQKRNIALPADLRDELLMLITE